MHPTRYVPSLDCSCTPSDRRVTQSSTKERHGVRAANGRGSFRIERIAWSGGRSWPTRETVGRMNEIRSPTSASGWQISATASRMSGSDLQIDARNWLIGGTSFSTKRWGPGPARSYGEARKPSSDLARRCFAPERMSIELRPSSGATRRVTGANKRRRSEGLRRSSERWPGAKPNSTSGAGFGGPQGAGPTT